MHIRRHSVALFPFLMFEHWSMHFYWCKQLITVVCVFGYIYKRSLVYKCIHLEHHICIIYERTCKWMNVRRESYVKIILKYTDMYRKSVRQFIANMIDHDHYHNSANLTAQTITKQTTSKHWSSELMCNIYTNRHIFLHSLYIYYIYVVWYSSFKA